MRAAARSRTERGRPSGSRAGHQSAALLGGNLDADHGALQIDFFGALGGFCENRYAIGKNLGKSANNGEMQRLPATKMVIAEFTDPQFGDERCVPWEDAEIAVLPRKLHFHDFLAEQLLLRGDDHQFDGLRQHFFLYALAFIFSAFPSASSIVPTI